MKAFRSVLSFWNEASFLASLLMGVGYFSSRGLLGYFPALLAILFVIAAGVLASLIAKSEPVSGDDFSDKPRFGFFDKFMLYFGLFLGGICLSTALGLYL